MKILILTSNPRKDLNLNEEIRDLKGVIERSRDREQLEVEVDLAVRSEDLQGLLLKYEPQIVHFCGHGAGEQGLVLQDDFGREQFVSTDALKDLFELFSETVECVLLNACYSEQQADEIVGHINYVIGMSQAIRDDAAIAFATGFYSALGYGRSVEQSYKFGCNQIHLTISEFSNSTRRSASEEQRKLKVVDVLERDTEQVAIPEYLKPKLKQKSNLIAVSNSVGVGSSEQLSSDEKVEIQINIDRAYDKEIKLKQYRDLVREFLADCKLTALETACLERLRQDLGLSVEDANQILAEGQEPIREVQEDYDKEVKLKQYCALVREFLADRKLSALETIRLERLRQDLGLSVEDANQILAEEQEPIREAQEDYEEILIRLIEEGYYSFSKEIKDELRSVCQELGLTDSEVEMISKPLLAAAEEDYRQQLGEEERKQALKREQELQQRYGLEQQYQEKECKQDKAKSKPPLQIFEFQVATFDIRNDSCNVNYRLGRAEYSIEDLGNGIILEMVAIPGGTFTMGSPADELERSDDEGPQHTVAVRPFHMSKFAVTQAQWREVAALPKVNCDLDAEPSYFKGDNRPVEQISWHEAVEFCDRISQRTEKSYRLPSEAEWEYACRAGTTTPFHFGETITTDLANYDGNYIYGSSKKGEYRRQTTDVGSFSPNAFGLYDMHGNVWEWCADSWHDNYDQAPVDGSIWTKCRNEEHRLLRGGSWYLYPMNCRSAYRNWYIPGNRITADFGFRILCSFPGTF